MWLALKAGRCASLPEVSYICNIKLHAKRWSGQNNALLCTSLPLFLTALKHLLDAAGFQACCRPSRTVPNTRGQEELLPALCARGCCRKEHPSSPFLLAASVAPACLPKRSYVRVPALGCRSWASKKIFPESPVGMSRAVYAVGCLQLGCSPCTLGVCGRQEQGLFRGSAVPVGSQPSV